MELYQSSFPERDSKETRKYNNIVLLQFQDYSLLKEWIINKIFSPLDWWLNCSQGQ